MSGRTVLFWDIDGTLLTTARAGVFALEAALTEVCAVELDLEELVTAGLTDAEVAALVIGTAGIEPAPETVDGFLRAYERYLPECLHRRRGHVMPGVIEILDDLGGRDDVVTLLLTGNTPAGARAKLEHYGLDRYFPRGGAFCARRENREEIARAAAVLANGTGPELMYVIGDTPHDVRAGKAIGARAIGIATGSHDAAALEEAGAWRVLEQLPEPRAFRRLVRLG
jgi:phosphoglycolate phosphatase